MRWKNAPTTSSRSRRPLGPPDWPTCQWLPAWRSHRAPNPEAAGQLIDHITQLDVQAATLREVGFFPVVEGDLPEDVSPGLQLEADAVAAQTDSPDALPSLLPIGLGDAGGDFNKIFVDAFTRIVLDGEEIGPVLEQQTEALGALMEETGAPCWEPDPPSDGEPCPAG